MNEFSLFPQKGLLHRNSGQLIRSSLTRGNTGKEQKKTRL
jgi:hypothetical protein